MKSNGAGKSSFTLAAAEQARIRRLRKLLKARSDTEVIRRSLKLLEESVSREELRRQFQEASVRVRSSTRAMVQQLDPHEEPGRVALKRRLKSIQGVLTAKGGKPRGSTRPTSVGKGQKTLADLVLQSRR